MKKLSERNKELLCQGANICGSFSEGYHYAEERLYIDEAKELKAFCEYIDKEIGGASRYNIDMLFRAFKNPNNKKVQSEAMELKALIADIDKRMKC